MRTTLNIDDDVFELARNLADSRKVSVGKALSDLARRGMQARSPTRSKGGFYTFQVPEGTPLFGAQEVQAALDAEDSELALRFLNLQRQ
jgi:hypothetical protein